MATEPTSLADLAVLAAFDDGGFTIMRLTGVETPRMSAPPRADNVVTVSWSLSERVIQRRAGQTFDSPSRPGESMIMPRGIESVWEGTIPASVRLAIAPELLAAAAVELGARRSATVPNVFRVADPVFAQVARTGMREVLDPTAGAPRLMAGGLATVVVARLLSRYRGGEISDPTPARSTAVRRAVVAIEERYAEDLSLQELADAARVSRFHLSRIFRREVGVTITEYLRAVRIDRAKQALRAGASVQQAAELVGMSPAHLIRVFRERTGLTPREWARQHR